MSTLSKRRMRELEGLRISALIIVAATGTILANAPGYFARFFERDELLILLALSPVWLLIGFIFGLAWYTLIRAFLSATRGERGFGRVKLLLSVRS